MRKLIHKEIIQNIKLYRHKSIVVRNFCLVLGMVVLPMLVVVMIVLNTMSDTVELEIEESNSHSLEVMSQAIDNLIDRTFSFSYYLAKSSDFGMLSFQQTDNEKHKTNLSREIRSYMLWEETVDSVLIYLDAKDQIFYSDLETHFEDYTLDKLKDTQWLTQYETYDGTSPFLLYSWKKDNKYPYIFTMVYFVENAGSREGAVVVNLNAREIVKNVITGIDGHGILYLLDEDGYVCFSNDLENNGVHLRMPEYLDIPWRAQGEHPSTVSQGEDSYQITIRDSDIGTYSYLLSRPITVYREQLDKIDNFVRSAVFFVLLIACGVAYVVSIFSYTPLRSVANEIKQIEADIGIARAEIHDNHHQEEQTRDELEYVMQLVRKAGMRNKRIQIETQDWMEKLKESQMQALQSQMNPHYLYNTLDIINWDAIEQLGIHNSVSDMLSSLASFLRGNLKETEYLHSVTQEVEHAKLYVKILERRYEGKIHVHWEIDENIRNCKILSLCLQPLIENAVWHGLRPKYYNGNIFITMLMEHNMIHITVEDDGIGMDEAKCQAMNKQLLADYDIDTDHMGVKNVNKRIKILFGDEYGIHLSKGKWGGLSVNMVLPIT